MISTPAQYLLRFDDLCPTISRARWECYRELIERFRLRPILAVVPENQDPDLYDSPADPDFWPKLRAMEAAGATIAVHGYRHLCRSRGKSLLGLHRRAEFAGVDLETQRKWILSGFSLLRDCGLTPRLWVAPRHGFDRNTLRALSGLGIRYISDGFARIPFRRHGVTWIPQQLWSPVLKRRGLWTICIHPNTSSSLVFDRLQSFLQDHADRFTSFERVEKEYPGKRLGWWERIYEMIALARVRRRHLRPRRPSSRSR